MAGCNEWDVRVDEAASDGQREVGVYSVEECMAACSDDLECVGFDLDTRDNPDSCWRHLDENNIKESRIRAQQGVILYILRERCQGIC